MLVETMTLPPSDSEQIRELNRLLQLGSPALVGPGNERIELPEGIYQLLKDIVRNMSIGRAISLVPQQQQMTTQAAAKPTTQPPRAAKAAPAASAAAPEGERCGHKSMNGRECTRPAGHAEKNHRYS